MSCSCFGASIVERRKDPAHNLFGIDGEDLNCGAHRTLPGNIKVYSYNELRSATNNFNATSNKIGRGGFGTVYKGVLKSGRQVAVKALSAESKQGVHEFLTEIEVIANVKHPNLVELIGCCVQGTNRILVYEYVENNSLDRALLGTRSKTIKLDWARRSAICLGTARGLSYLHEELEPHIVHRDIKASNILLDKEFVPKIGDFGLAKLFPENITHISTRVAGTTGYLAPEYAMQGQLTKKADVYSFGVLVLEIVSGRSSSRQNWGGMQKLLLEWTWQLYEEGKLVELVDPELEEYPEDQVVRYIKVALFCTQATANQRPTMSQVLTMLSKSNRLNEKDLMAPGFFTDGAGNSRTHGSSSDKKSTSNSISQTMSSFPVSITQVTPR
ncbi:Protein kinase domain [Macleaya cordata]|uniref:Protein kinase domain n=1 Tax=Macleaya cordata TaxID=56857 RepID=A0A200PQT3_MACCD|nr:Protein kinase domain [Macleaya cordata]